MKVVTCTFDEHGHIFIEHVSSTNVSKKPSNEITIALNRIFPPTIKNPFKISLLYTAFYFSLVFVFAVTCYAKNNNNSNIVNCVFLNFLYLDYLYVEGSGNYKLSSSLRWHTVVGGSLQSAFPSLVLQYFVSSSISVGL